MLDVRRLRLLRELAHRGTIAAVADALMFSPSAVSQQLAVLEREAGVPLLERNGRGVVLTPAGRKLVEHTEAVLERLEQAAGDLADARQGLAGPLRIGTFPSAARTIVVTALVVLGRAHPALEPCVEEIDPADVGDALRAGELDVALVHEYDFVPAEDPRGMATEPLLSEPLFLASPRGSALPCDVDEPDPIRRWREAPWILAKPRTMCHTMAVRVCQAKGFTPSARHHVDDFATVLAFVAAGQGVALVPQLGAADPPEGVVLTGLPLSRRTEVACRRGAGRHPAVTAFTSALRAALPRP
jgi:DNA-binding transcriptional LysR family regulator